MTEFLVYAAGVVLAVAAGVTAGFLSREQASGIEQVNRAVTSMEAATQQNAALVEEATAAARALSGQATSLMKSIGRYRLRHADAPVAAQTAIGGSRVRA